VDEDVQCDVVAVGLDLMGEGVDNERRDDGCKQTILGPNQQLCIIESGYTYENEDHVRKTSPLEVTNVVLHCGHFIVVVPDRLFVPPQRFWQKVNAEYSWTLQSIVPRRRATIILTLSSSSQDHNEQMRLCNRESDGPICPRLVEKIGISTER